MLTEFSAKGVVVVPDVFSAAEIEEMRREADYIAGISLNAVRTMHRSVDPCGRHAPALRLSLPTLHPA